MNIKNKLIAATTGLLCMAALPALAQKGGARPAFNKGDNTIGIFAGAGIDYGYYSGVNAAPAVGVLYDHGIIDNVGPGTIGIGGVVAVKTARYAYTNNDARWTNVFVAVRATYHLTILKNKNNKFDPYGGVMAGIRSYGFKDENFPNRDDNYIRPVSGLFVGAKYNFTPAFGAFAEVGYDISFLKVGLNFNF